MATADEYAAWIVKNAAKKGTPEFDTVAKAYQQAKGGGEDKVAAQLEADRKQYAPTVGMSGFEKFSAGVGKSVYDTARGLGQFVGATSREDVGDARARDKALSDTTAGKVGEFAGNVAQMVPLAFVPGANTVKGASIIGGLTGLAQQSESTGETLQNAGLGTLAGGGSILAGRGLAAGYQAVTGALRPMTKGGQRQIAAELLQTSATNPQAAAKRLGAARELVPGSTPTVGQASDDAGLAQLERTLLNKPETAGPLNMRYQAQQTARQKAIGDVAGTPQYRADIEDGRAIFAAEDYGNAMKAGVNVASGAGLRAFALLSLALLLLLVLDALLLDALARLGLVVVKARVSHANPASR